MQVDLVRLNRADGVEPTSSSAHERAKARTQARGQAGAVARGRAEAERTLAAGAEHEQRHVSEQAAQVRQRGVERARWWRGAEHARWWRVEQAGAWSWGWGVSERKKKGTETDMWRPCGSGLNPRLICLEPNEIGTNPT